MQVGQNLMAVRSLNEIWVDANFKETQLRDLRIGQPVDLHVDMYSGTHVFKGRMAGFTEGTGSTLALLPPENATGNFIKVVQRLPVRIDLVDYDADQTPLFIGTSVVPDVHINKPPTGPDAGKLLQTYVPQTGTSRPRPDSQRIEHKAMSGAVASTTLPTVPIPRGDKPLGRRRRCRGADVHGGAGHYDRGGGAALYRGRTVGHGR